MTGFYIRWGVILLVALGIGFLGVQRYERDVAAISPDQLLQNPAAEKVRVIGTIQGGSLSKEEEQKRAVFRLQGEKEILGVRYQGEDLDTLRELKVLVISGRWNPETREFDGDSLSLIPNYGFVVAAYLIGIVPTLLFLYLMERRLRLLYNDVKQAKLYEPESASLDEG
ncbi:MAG: cytochrome c maturation protein CcmE [Nitrospirae bacterium]|nr:cytochrome c maturation protein CcmE [Nitrospirota bacterium]